MEARGTAPTTSRGESPGRDRAVLLVEDSPLQRRVLADHLRAVGFRVRSAPTAADAYVRLGEGRPDAVVCDVVLPGLDGFALCRSLADDPELGEMPVVLVTSTDVDESDRLLARRAGAAALVGRHPGYDAVVEALVAALGRAAGPAGGSPTGGTLGDLRAGFLAEGRRRSRALLERSGEAWDWPALRGAAHRWIGRGGALGFPAIAEGARGLDTAASNVDAEGARASLQALARMFEGAEAARREAGERPGPAGPAAEEGPVAREIPAAGRRDVVLADDDATVVAIVRATLENEGWRCHVAENGVEALALARRVRPAAVIVDVNMPGRDGFEVLAELRGQRATRAVPVLLLTARHQEIDVLRGFDLGAADYVVKPFNPLELAARLRRLAPGGE